MYVVAVHCRYRACVSFRVDSSDCCESRTGLPMAVSVRTKLALVLTHVALSPVTAVALMSQQVGIPKQFFDLRDPDRNILAGVLIDK